MANKFIPKASGAVRNPKFPTKGPHNPNVGTHGSGPAPRNASAGQRTDKLSMPVQGGIARVRGVSSSPTGKSGSAGSFTPPMNNAMANQTGQRVGQREAEPIGPGIRTSPMTTTPTVGNSVATKKPNRKGGAAFYGE